MGRRRRCRRRRRVRNQVNLQIRLLGAVHRSGAGLAARRRSYQVTIKKRSVALNFQVLKAVDKFRLTLKQRAATDFQPAGAAGRFSIHQLHLGRFLHRILFFLLFLFCSRRRRRRRSCSCCRHHSVRRAVDLHDTHADPGRVGKHFSRRRGESHLAANGPPKRLLVIYSSERDPDKLKRQDHLHFFAAAGTGGGGMWVTMVGIDETGAAELAMPPLGADAAVALLRSKRR